MRGFEPRACSLLNYRSTAELHRRMSSVELRGKSKRTARFELARAEPSRFRVYPINRSGTSAVYIAIKLKNGQESGRRDSNSRGQSPVDF